MSLEQKLSRYPQIRNIQYFSFISGELYCCSISNFKLDRQRLPDWILFSIYKNFFSFNLLLLTQYFDLMMIFCLQIKQRNNCMRLSNCNKYFLSDFQIFQFDENQQHKILINGLTLLSARNMKVWSMKVNDSCCMYVHPPSESCMWCVIVSPSTHWVVFSSLHALIANTCPHLSCCLHLFVHDKTVIFHA